MSHEPINPSPTSLAWQRKALAPAGTRGPAFPRKATPRHVHALRRAFTLMELMVAVSILVVIILAVGMIFSSASKSVGMSQNTMDMLDGVRATQQALAREIAGLDKNGFLVIRSRIFSPIIAVNDLNLHGGQDTLHFDQLCFMTYGTYPDRTGSAGTHPFANPFNANAAIAWWGQLLMENHNAIPLANQTDSSVNPIPWGSYVSPNQAVGVAAYSSYPKQPPTGVCIGTSGNSLVPQFSDLNSHTIRESPFTLGHHLLLLVPQQINAGTITVNGTRVPAFASPALGATIPAGATSEGAAADITSSRYDVVALSPSQVMEGIEVADNANGPGSCELYQMTYRFRALTSATETEVTSNPFVNGYARTTPIVMSGITSFKVEWTDGAVWGTAAPDNLSINDPRVGQLKWYGPMYPSNFGNGNANIERIPFSPANQNGFDVNNGDQYEAVFSYANHPYWPRALRITMHVGGERLPAGRDFTQVINLPE